MSYRQHFESKEAARNYEDSEYARSSYSSLLWDIERSQLDVLIQDHFDIGEFDLLDFACGTGRVLQHVAELARDVTGIEIAKPMVEIAQAKMPNFRILCRDITSPGSEIEGRYDVITAFRFFLNAEPALRQACLAALKERLRNEHSMIVFNNHANLASHKAIMAFPAWVLRRGRRLSTGNLMTDREVRTFVLAAGLQIERVAGTGLLGGRVATKLPPRLVVRLERAFARSKLSRFGSHQIYVAFVAP